MPTASHRLPGLRPRRLILPLAAVLVAATPAAGHAASVQTGALTWTSAAVYDTSAPANTNRTWLGYVTGPPPTAGGTATPSAGATGDTVTVASPRGLQAAYAWRFPATGGTFDPATRTGAIELRGTVTFASTLHGFTITVQDPQLVLAGSTGTLQASGSGSLSMSPGSTSSYDRSKPLFALDLTTATVATAADGTTTIAGMVPSIATSPWAFPSNYAVGAGPERTPNTFGSLALSVGPGAAAVPAPAPAPATGAIATTVARGAGAGTVRLTLARAPGASANRTYLVRLTRDGRVIATGSLRGRRATLTLRRTKAGYPALRGTYKLAAASPLAKLLTSRLVIG